MGGALLYYRLTALQNLVVHRLRRLREPKYLFFTLVAVAYLYYFVFRRVSVTMIHSPGWGRPAGDPGSLAGSMAVPLTCTGLALLALLRLAFTWGWPPQLAAFRFSEAEIAFLFPAPIPRRTLIHYRLLASQATILFGAVLMALVFTRGEHLAVHRVYRTVGWWLMFSLFDLHLNGTRLALTHLRAESAHFNLFRLAGVTAIIVYVASVGWGVYFALVELANGGDIAQLPPSVMALAVSQSPVLFWLTLPFRVAFGPYAATNFRDFLLALGPALAFFALHYYWVLSTETRFEEGSIAQAEKRAALKAAARRGEAVKLGTVRASAAVGPFPLAPTGWPELAFLWKNLLSMRSGFFTRRALFILGGLLFWGVVGLRPLLLHGSSRITPDEIGQLVAVFGAILGGYTLFLGPQLARQDLRGDLTQADLLKTYPLEGWRLALGELLAPTLLLSLVLWVILGAVAVTYDPNHQLEWLTPTVRTTTVVCLALGAPLVCVLQLLVPNTIMILLPGWYQAARSRSGGIEMFGQRLIFGLLQFLFMPLLFLPTLGWAAVVFLGSFHWIGVGPALFCSFLMAVFLLGAAVAVGLWWLGARFGRFDLTSELK